MATKKVGVYLNYETKSILGRGTFGIVFKGFFEINRYSIDNKEPSSITVAVKRILKKEPEAPFIQQEVEHMKRAGDHPNILRYICIEKDDRFVYVVTELCKGTLEDYVKGKYRGPKFSNEADILFQVTRGLAHLHNKNIVHRDIKPNNILIFVPDGHGADPVMKLADFGISKGLNTGREDFTNTSITNPSGTIGWMAPEVYTLKRFDFKVDIFPLGCIFGYVLSRGRHPFGDDPDKRLVLIKDQQPMLLVQKDLMKPHSKDGEAFELIKLMLEMDPSKRPTAENVLNNEFFKIFSVEGRTQQLVNICNHSLGAATYSEVTPNEYDSACQQLINLLSYGKVNVNTRIAYEKSPLLFLCKCFYMKDNLIDLVKLLIQNGADVNVKDEYAGRTPLHYLCYCNRKKFKNKTLIDVLKFLIQSGADVNAKINNGETPFHLLFRYYQNDNFFDFANLLIQSGADVNAKDRYGSTPLHFLCRDNKNDHLIDIAKLLLQNGGDVNAKNEYGQTPLHLLSPVLNEIINLIDLVQLLIQHRADVNAKDEYGSTPLHHFFELYSYEFNRFGYKSVDLIINLLVQNGANVKAKAKNGMTPLHLLCKYYKGDNVIDLVKLLIQNGADVNVKDEHGKTPLHSLCEYQCKKYNLNDLANLLIQNGANVNAKNKREETPLDVVYIYQKDNQEFIDFLKKKEIENDAEMDQF